MNLVNPVLLSFLQMAFTINKRPSGANKLPVMLSEIP